MRRRRAWRHGRGGVDCNVRVGFETALLSQTQVVGAHWKIDAHGNVGRDKAAELLRHGQRHAFQIMCGYECRVIKLLNRVALGFGKVDRVGLVCKHGQVVEDAFIKRHNGINGHPDLNIGRRNWRDWRGRRWCLGARIKRRRRRWRRRRRGRRRGRRWCLGVWIGRLRRRRRQRR